MDTTIVQDILERNSEEKDSLIAILGDIQNEFGYLPEDALRMVSEETGKALIDLFSIASFYNAFNLKPQGKHLIQVCLGTACHVRGGHRVLEEVKHRLNLEVGDTTEDQQFTLKTVNCLGACALGPIVVVDNQYHGNTRIQKVNSILNKYRNLNE